MRTPVAIAVGALLAAPSFADGRAGATPEELRHELGALSQRLERVEAEVALARLPAIEKGAKEAAWAGRVRLKGDLRYRHEQIDDASQPKDRVRHRVRVRFGLDARVNEAVKAVVQVATAGDDRDPRSTNQTLGEGSTRKGVGLDLAYVAWEPVKGVEVRLGKTPYAWQRVGSYFWDGDITWEGGAVRLARGPVFASAFGSWLSESGSGADASLLGGQLGVKTKLGDDATLTAAVGYFDVGSVQGAVTAGSSTPACTASKAFFGGAQGNRTEVIGGCRRLRDDFDLVEVLAKADFGLGALPVSVFGDYVRNRAALDGDTGYSVGVTLGKAGDARSWELGYVYQDMEQNAQFGQFVDSDFGAGNTYSKGSVIRAAWSPAKNWTLNGTYFVNERVLPGPAAVSEAWRGYDRLQLDFNYKF